MHWMQHTHRPAARSSVLMKATAGLIPPNSQNASVRTAADRCGVHFVADSDGPVAKGAARDQVRKEMPMLPLVLSSDSHVFEPPDLWQTRIDLAFRDRAPRIERIDGGDHVVVEADQILSGSV